MTPEEIDHEDLCNLGVGMNEKRTILYVDTGWIDKRMVFRLIELLKIEAEKMND